MNEIVHADQQLFLFLNNLGTTTFDSFWMFITNKWSSIPLYALLLVLCFVKLGWKRTLLVLVMVALMIAGTDQLANAFKYGVERLRPCHTESLLDQMRLVKPYCGGQYGYFSAHAASSMAVAVFFGKLFKPYLKWMLPLLLLWSITVGYSRIYIGVHFPLDVLTGYFFGTLIALLISVLNKKLVLRFKL
ncbi:undecaprenyl-diphosphatase [Pustulibacterium marinum]|uniref:Undecaprenyl-diphosphatase n=1 Tax=Pustulibacterium marinum TaxID=1224947 RepID=A0A1I7F9E1_9FLAO|nr:phosphatase PAP2 family protein [Pustulibacterium marinum]SFU32749.1 undecaprenyl-diphosphatase [Pustulibacterium marinum]